LLFAANKACSLWTIGKYETVSNLRFWTSLRIIEY
jgi:hypothetical protein